MREKITLQMKEGVCEAYVFQPDNAGGNPSVLLLMDAFGIREALLEFGEEISKAGMRVLVPNLYYRSAKLPILEYPKKFSPEHVKEVFPVLNRHRELLTPENIIADGEIYLGQLGDNIALVGLCMGVGHALRLASAFPKKILSISGLHGGNLVTDMPDSPHLLGPKLKASVFLGFADHDGSMPDEKKEALEKALRDAGVQVQTKTYKNANHGYTMKDLPAFYKKAHDEALQDTIHFFLH